MPRLAKLASQALSDIRRLGQPDSPTGRALLRAAWELAIARWRLATSTPADLLAVAPKVHNRTNDIGTQAKRVASAVAAMGARVPWRSDCLVQALAGQRWLARLGIASDLHIGVQRPTEARLDAHAWLTVGEEVVIGGETGAYAPLVTPDRHRR